MAPLREQSASGGGSSSKATWKLDASLDEVIEFDMDEQWRGGQSKGSWSGKAENYWDAGNGSSYKPAKPPVFSKGGKGGSGWASHSWEENGDFGDSWSGTAPSKGADKGKGRGSRWDEGWRDSGYSDTWEADGGTWSSGKSWGGLPTNTSWSQSGGDWQAGWTNGGGGSSSSSWKGSSGGGASWGAARSEPEPAPPPRGVARTDGSGFPATGSSRSVGDGYGSYASGGAGHHTIAESDPYSGGAVARKHQLDYGQVDEEPPQRHWKRVKVTNIPDKLPARDIQSAFEAATGRILHFEMDRGTALITFSEPRHAVKAADTFDRGQLNGAIIEVKIVP
mmetsp:Transcript_90693/g.240951  ORF Transcript_90693/g.240951 Transcript_90693/m.240951 type:complete len:336 (-) Transcript_90693:115-1122(-)